MSLFSVSLGCAGSPIAIALSRAFRSLEHPWHSLRLHNRDRLESLRYLDLARSFFSICSHGHASCKKGHLARNKWSKLCCSIIHQHSATMLILPIASGAPREKKSYLYWTLYKVHWLIKIFMMVELECSRSWDKIDLGYLVSHQFIAHLYTWSNILWVSSPQLKSYGCHQIACKTHSSVFPPLLGPTYLPSPPIYLAVPGLYVSICALTRAVMWLHSKWTMSNSRNPTSVFPSHI